jgi:hypothetical protein
MPATCGVCGHLADALSRLGVTGAGACAVPARGRPRGSLVSCLAHIPARPIARNPAWAVQCVDIKPIPLSAMVSSPKVAHHLLLDCGALPKVDFPVK